MRAHDPWDSGVLGDFWASDRLWHHTIVVRTDDEAAAVMAQGDDYPGICVRVSPLVPKGQAYLWDDDRLERLMEDALRGHVEEYHFRDQPAPPLDLLALFRMGVDRDPHSFLKITSV